MAEKVGKRFGERWVLRGISLEVCPGESLGILGPNGSGKSTLLSCLAGQLRPDEGEVRLGGRIIGKISARERARLVAVLEQEGTGNWPFTVEEVVEMGRHPHQGRWLWPGERDRRVVEEVLEMTCLTQLRHRMLAELSGGERQRVALARVMAQEPGLLLLDEPTTYLDVHYQLALLDLIERWRRERNLAVVMVLHDLNLAAQYCDRLLLIRNGMMVRSGTPEEVLESDLLGEVFGVRPRVVRHPDLAVPQVLLSSRWRGADSPSVSAKG